MELIARPVYWLLAISIAAYVVVRVSEAQELRVDLELVLAVDISLSMDPNELQIQRDGYSSAFRHDEVIDALKSNGYGRIAVTYLEWAGVDLQRVVVPWTLITNKETAAAFADRLDAAEINQDQRTSIGDALKFASRQFDGNAFNGLRRVIDISGDGPNNHGPVVTILRDAVVAQGITINGLPIMVKPLRGHGRIIIPELDEYYEDCVIGGTGAFLVTVESIERMELAIRRKLVLEIAGLEPQVVPAQLSQNFEQADCEIGEKMYMEYLKRSYSGGQ